MLLTLLKGLKDLYKVFQKTINTCCCYQKQYIQYILQNISMCILCHL